MPKRTLDAFFQPSPEISSKRSKADSPPTNEETNGPPGRHATYPFDILNLPSHIESGLVHATPAHPPRAIRNQPQLDLLHFQPYISRATANELFRFLRRGLPFYRVRYSARRGDTETVINTPRFTTVFGVDATSKFVSASTVPGTSNLSHTPTPPTTTTTSSSNRSDDTNNNDKGTKPAIDTNNLILVDATTNTPIPPTKYQHAPRPIPPCLDILRQQVEAAAGNTDKNSYNFCLVNYYASGDDSIAFHADDERFLGRDPSIASLSLGGERDFVMKHKPFPAAAAATTTTTTTTTTGAVGGSTSSVGGTIAASSSMRGGTSNSVSAFASPTSLNGNATPQIKMGLASGDMVVMQGPTQAHWLHSIPKRKSAEAGKGRINITFRRAVVPGGTNNYYHYNVGEGGVYRWEEKERRMVLT
ncbi:Oxoglutarate/iron-dependent dioxygenase [Penicillium alfredii]|uniref:Oxoglutarate/iron-dependent dioxygenase n=1 Tax=Penicillium alfredii TaxID=1506179 RepID=A0A9W9KD08_9EURO|nr:Oxoglutarate/iron-dependent dioxygenase [Penicillium alfredii]KAJ5101311.1 Oxoglutarate/iron-dependent dioxygenase [Penicillium alfredii]